MIATLISIDLKSLIAFTVLLFGVSGTFLFLVFRIRQYLLFKWLAYGCLSFALGWLLFIVRFTVGINLITLPLANILILLMPITLSLAVADLFKIKLPKLYWPAIAFVLTFTFALLTWSMHNPWIPGIYTSALNGILYCLPSLLILRSNRPRNPITLLILGLILSTVMLLVLRAFILLFGWLYPDSIDDSIRNGLLTVTLLLNITCINAQMLCFPILDFMEAQQELTTVNQQLEELSNIDELTGLLNRRKLKAKVDAEISRYQQDHTPFSIILCDLDFFKQVNDSYGHLVGDIVLETVAKLIKYLIRPQDLVIRYGGEEFIILLLDTDHREAYKIAERLRLEIADICFCHPDLPKSFQVTASFGLANLSETLLSPKDLLHQADLALYQAKHQGRNQVCIAAQIALARGGELDNLQTGVGPGVA